jgi:hypothetical protein
VYYWVWTRESYRAPTFPFGHQTLWSVTVGQTFAYDGHNIADRSLHQAVLHVGPPVLSIDRRLGH